MIGLIDYGIGNLLSVAKAVEHLSGQVRIFDRADEMEKFDGLILPGVGNFGDGMEQLQSRGFVEPLRQWAHRDQPLFGICLGMQLFLDGSEEAPGVAGLSITPGTVKLFPSGVEKVPHMGWNSITVEQEHPLLQGIADGEYFYFVHSYYVKVTDPRWRLASCDYICRYSAIIGQGRVCATQFHPEKSQDAGLKLLGNFIAMVGGTACPQVH